MRCRVHGSSVASSQIYRNSHRGDGRSVASSHNVRSSRNTDSPNSFSASPHKGRRFQDDTRSAAPSRNGRMAHYQESTDGFEGYIWPRNNADSATFDRLRPVPERSERSRSDMESPRALNGVGMARNPSLSQSTGDASSISLAPGARNPPRGSPHTDTWRDVVDRWDSVQHAEASRPRVARR
jgi:hypothetical protein